MAVAIGIPYDRGAKVFRCCESRSTAYIGFTQTILTGKLHLEDPQSVAFQGFQEWSLFRSAFSLDLILQLAARDGKSLEPGEIPESAHTVVFKLTFAP